jgi:hypothetical protein
MQAAQAAQAAQMAQMAMMRVRLRANKLAFTPLILIAEPLEEVVTYEVILG